MIDLKPEQFHRIATIAQERWGLALTERKMSLVANRVGSLLRRNGFAKVDAYLEFLQHGAGQEEMLAFFDVLSTNVTSFFRDPAHFEYLEREVYTPLVRGNLTRPDRKLRIWSAGCSIGCEPYSLAINALDSLGPNANWDVLVLATDLSNTAVEQARRGEYDQRQVESLNNSTLQQHFRRSRNGSTYSVASHVRDNVRVARLNLMDPWPMKGPFDIIFCRNVMIYFDLPTRERLVGRFHQYLRPGGIFAVGSAETLSGLDTPFKSVQASVYRK
jgi:chemotaxis protein methyltransferase CheR